MNLNPREHKGNLRSLNLIDGARYLCVGLVLLDPLIGNDTGGGDQM